MNKIYEDRVRSYVLLLIGNTLAGVGSGLLFPTFAIRGGILGMFLGFTTIFVNRYSCGKLDVNSSPSKTSVFLIALFLGCLCGITMMIIAPYLSQIEGTQHGIIYTIILFFSYVVTIQMAYQKRWDWSSRWAPWVVKIQTILMVILATAFCSLLRILLSLSMIKRGHDAVGIFFLFFLFGGLPFAIGWFLTTSAFDPGWSYERWALGKSSKKESLRPGSPLSRG